VDVLAASGALTGAERGADRQRRVVRGGHARPGDTAEQRALARGAHPTVLVRGFEAGQHAIATGDQRDGAADYAALLPLLPGACRDERVVGGPVREFAGRAVSGDGAVHQAWIGGAEILVGDAESLRCARRETLDQHVGGPDQRTERPRVRHVLEVQYGAAFSSTPDPVPGQGSGRIALGWLDLGDIRAVVGEQHRGHRARYATGEVEHPDAVEYACHLDAPR
jgi:hypothetical protein